MKELNTKSTCRAFLPALLLLVAAGCNGGNGEEQDVISEDAAPDEAADPVQDDVQDLQPEDMQPDPDAVVDPVEEDTVDEDVPAEAEDALSEDVLEEPETPCEESGGYCWYFYITYPACITCPDREGRAYLPSPPADREQGCTVEGTGTGPWCCVPDWGSGTSTCEGAGGACYPDEGDYVCPVGWEATLVECDEASTVCCLPIPAC